MAELDIFQDTTADVAFADTTAMAAEEQTETSEESLQYGDAIDWEATYEDAAKYLGVSEDEWRNFVEEVNAIKAEMNAYEGNAARVMQERSTTNALRDRRVAVLLNQNPGMTPEEAIAQVESDPNYQATVSSFEQYEALNTRLNDLYASIGLDPQGTITGSDKSVEGGEIRFDLNTGGIEFIELGQTGKYAKLGIGIAAGFIFGGPLGQALAQGLGVSAGAGVGAVSGVAGSAISQGIAGGKVDVNQLLTAGILGGIGGLADDLANGVQQTGAIPNAIDNAIWDLSGTLGMSYDETLRILEGITTGAITGSDIESIVLNAVGGYSEAKVAGLMRDYFGDSIDIENFFREGDTTIPIEALTPFVGTAIQGLIDGGVSTETILTTLYDYFDEGGSLDFLLPALPEGVFSGLDIPNLCEAMPNFPGLCKQTDLCEEGEDGEKPWYCRISLPDVRCPKWMQDEEGNCRDIECPEWAKDEQGNCLDILPDIELCTDEELAKGGKTIRIGTPDSWFCQLPEVDIECPDGLRYDPERGECIQIPEVDIECPDGLRYDPERGECIQIPRVGSIECPEGLRYDEERGECVQIPKLTCPEGFRDENGECVEIDLPSVDLPSVSLPSFVSPEEAGFETSKVMGLSYRPQQMPGLLTGPSSVDALGELNKFISNQLQKRDKRMLT